MFDLLIVGGGPAAVSCGLVLSSAKNQEYMQGKKVAMIACDKVRDLDVAVLNNYYGVASDTKGKDLNIGELERLNSFNFIEQLPEDEIKSVFTKDGVFEVQTVENTYLAKQVVLAIGHSPKIEKIAGLENYITEHKKSLPGQKKYALKNTDLVVTEGLYAAGLTSGCASQVAIAVGTGADLAIRLMTKWNDNVFTHYHDK